MLTSQEREEVQRILKNGAQKQAEMPLPVYERQPLVAPSSAMITPLPQPLPLYPIFNQQSTSQTECQAGPSTSHRNLQSKGRSQQKERKRRSCRKCGQTSDKCYGAMFAQHCKNPCRDCGGMDCPGRDPKNWKNNKQCPNYRGPVNQS
jgi:hypothetical protein